MTKESTLRNRLRRRGYHLVSKHDGYGCKNYAISDENRFIVDGYEYSSGEFYMDLSDVEQWIRDFDSERCAS